jgi:ABC-type multidrug transport system fused ATPase/permease subunit
VLTGCLASDRPIVLLDEAFANLDHASRTRIPKSNLLAERTVIAVLHEEAGG